MSVMIYNRLAILVMWLNQYTHLTMSGNAGLKQS